MGRRKAFHSGDTIHVGKDCERCVFCKSSDDNIHVFCDAKQKTYMYGQSIICEDRKEN